MFTCQKWHIVVLGFDIVSQIKPALNSQLTCAQCASTQASSLGLFLLSHPTTHISVFCSFCHIVMDQALCPAIGVAVLQLVDLMLRRECWQLPNDSGWAWE